jgi:hypothetical protein
MGKSLLDKYSLLHFASGIVAYFFGLSFYQWFILHMFFELVENSVRGIDTINKYFASFWPGGKPSADKSINMVGDQISAVTGWLIGYYIDNLNI